MEKKKSSIEWFAEKLASQALLVVDDYPNLMAYQQAKAMHQKEIIDAYDDGWHHNNEDKYNPIKYYNEHYEQ